MLTSLKSLTFENYFLFSQLALFCELHRIRDRGRVYEKSKQSQNKSIAINIDSWHDLVGTHIQFIWPLVNAGAFKSPAGAVSLASSIRHTYKTCQTVSIHIHVRVYWIISFMGSKYPTNVGPKLEIVWTRFSSLKNETTIYQPWFSIATFLLSPCLTVHIRVWEAFQLFRV